MHNLNECCLVWMETHQSYINWFVTRRLITRWVFWSVIWRCWGHCHLIMTPVVSFHQRTYACLMKCRHEDVTDQTCYFIHIIFANIWQLGGPVWVQAHITIEMNHGIIIVSKRVLKYLWRFTYLHTRGILSNFINMWLGFNVTLAFLLLLGSKQDREMNDLLRFFQ